MKRTTVLTLHALAAAAVLAVSCAGVPRGRTTELHAAANTGDLAVLDDLLVDEKDVDARDESGKTALHHASIAGDVPFCGALLNAGADPNLPDVDGRTSLHYAVLSRDPDLVAMLLAADADAGLLDDDDRSPTDLAAESGYEDVRDVIESAAEGFIPDGA